MKKIVRIGDIEDQDNWRRDDTGALTPNQRVAIVVEMQNQYSRENKIQTLTRKACVRSRYVTTL